MYNKFELKLVYKQWSVISLSFLPSLLPSPSPGLHNLTAALLFILNSSQIYHMSSITLLSGGTMKSHLEKDVLGYKDQDGLGHSHSI